MKRLFAIVALSCALAQAQSYKPTLQPHQVFVDSAGNPCAGCKLYSYVAGTTTPQVTYSDSIGTPNTNPVVLGTDGGADLWFSLNSYKLTLKDTSGAPLWTVDNVSQIGLGLNYLPLTGGTLSGSLTGTTATFSGAVQGSVFNGAGTGLTGSAAGLSVGGTAAALAGGAVGSIPYQSAAGATGFIASPTTSGHTFVLAWQPAGSAIAPTAVDVATYLASPPAIGGTAAAAGSFTTLSGSTSVQVAGGTAVTDNQGTGAKVQHSTGTVTSGNCVQFDASGNTTDSGAPCVAPPHLVATSGIFTTCIMVGHSSTDVSCTGTQAWSNSITGTYYTLCMPYQAGFAGGPDSVGMTRAVMGIAAQTSTNFTYWTSSLQGGTVGANEQAYCVAFQ